MKNSSFFFYFVLKLEATYHSSCLPDHTAYRLFLREHLTNLVCISTSSECSIRSTFWVVKAETVTSSLMRVCKCEITPISSPLGRVGTEKCGDFDTRCANIPTNWLSNNPRPNGEQLSSHPRHYPATMDSNLEGPRWEKLEASLLGDPYCERCVQLIIRTPRRLP